jgi:pilus assembly protein CpaC
MHEPWSGLRNGSGDVMLEHNRLTAAWPPIARWCLLSVMLLLLASPAWAADQVIDISDGQRTGKLMIAVGKSETVRVSEPFQDVVLGNPGIANMAPLTDRSLYVLGQAIGTTNLAFYDSAGDLIAVIDIEVTHDLSDLREALHKAVPSARVNVRSANGRVMLDGTVPDAVALDRVLSIAREFAREAGQDEAGRVINALTVASPQQVMLEVRIIEAQRSSGRDLGVHWNVNVGGFKFATIGGRSTRTTTREADDGTQVLLPFDRQPIGPNFAAPTLAGGGTPFGVAVSNLLNNGHHVDVVISALEEAGIVRRLAEPNLTTLSGQPAKFHAGGSIPVVTQGGATTEPTVDLKDFGVLLGFTPTVLADGIINLKIEPEVSEVDFSIAVQGNPGFRKRTASTTVELRDGQSLAMAGLLQTNHTRTKDQVPWLGDVPVLGALFRSSGFQKNETELVVIVTPRLVVPVPPGVALATPLDNLAPSNDPELVLFGKLEVSKEYLHMMETGGAVTGPFGHMRDLPKDNNHVTTK